MSWSVFSKPTTPARERSRGFTLIELMMVVVIIGIMSAIAIGAYTKNIRRARQTAVVANLSKISLREAAVFSLRGHYATTTASEEETYPPLADFTTVGGPDSVPWDIAVDGYTSANGSGLYFTGGPLEHGFDALSFMPDGGSTRCGYGVISGFGTLGSLPNGEPVVEEPPAQPLANEIWSQQAASLYARDWFYAFARCDFDRDGNTWDFTLTHVDSGVNMGDGSAT